MAFESCASKVILYCLVSVFEPTFNLPNFTQERILVETYKSGNDWYNLYSDGWLEQGGVKSGAGNVSVTLLKSFSDAKYFISTTSYYSALNYNSVLSDSRSTNSFTRAGGPANHDTFWYACGYTSKSNKVTNTHIIKY